MRLTPRQEEILGRLRGLAEQSTEATTLGELCGLLGLRSHSALRRHLGALTRAGYLEPPTKGQRGIRLAPQPPRDDQLPLLGSIAAGRPIEVTTQPEFIQIPPHLRTARPCYVLAVVGDSMRDAGILDGDQVIVEQRDQAPDGAIVVALIHGSEATLKRIQQRPGQIILRAENPDIPPLVFRPDEVQIQGVVVGQMRAYR